MNLIENSVLDGWWNTRRCCFKVQILIGQYRDERDKLVEMLVSDWLMQ